MTVKTSFDIDTVAADAIDTFNAMLADIKVLKATVTPAPTPSPPSITTPAAINSDGTPQVGELLTGVDPVVVNGVVTARRWLLGSTVLTTNKAYTPTVTGDHRYQADITGTDGSTLQSSATITVAAATPNLTLSNVLSSITTSTAAGTKIADIGNVPSGVAPTISPADGRFVIAGSQSAGWTIVRGMTAVSVGTLSVAVAATGATGASVSIEVTAAAAFSMTASQVSSQPADSLLWERQQASDNRALTFAKATGDDTALWNIIGDTITLSRQAYVAGKTFKGNFTATDSNGAAVPFSLSRTIDNTIAPIQASESFSADMTVAAGTKLHESPDGRWHRSRRESDINGDRANPHMIYTSSGTLVPSASDPADDRMETCFTVSNTTNPKVIVTARAVNGGSPLNLCFLSDKLGQRLVARASGMASGADDPTSTATGNMGLDLFVTSNWSDKAACPRISGFNYLSAYTGRPTVFTFAFDLTAKTVTVSVNSSASTQVYDISGLVLTSQNKDFGFGSQTPYGGGGSTAISSYQYSTAAGSFTAVSAPSRSSSNVITQRWRSNGFTAQDVDFQLVDPSSVNTVRQDWSAARIANVSGNEFDVIMTAPGGRTSYLVNIRNRRDTAIVGIGSQPVQTYSTTNVYFGVNPGEANYYNGVPMMGNWGWYVSLKNNFSADQKWSDGGVQVLFPKNGIPAGDYTFETSTGSTFNSIFDNKTANCEIVSSDPTTGVHVVRVKGDVTTQAADLRCLGFSAKITKFVVTKFNGAAVPLINPYWIEFHKQFDGIRLLNLADTNDLTPNKTDAFFPARGAVTNLDPGMQEPFENFVNGMNALKAANGNVKDLWYPIPVQASRAVVKRQIAYAKANLHVEVRLIAEGGNEIWNRVTFQRTNTPLVHLAITSKWYSKTATYANRDTGAAPTSIYTDFEPPAGSSDTLAGMRSAVVAGTYVWHPCSAGSLFLALKDNPAATPFSDTTAWDASPTTTFVEKGTNTIGPDDLCYRGHALRNEMIVSVIDEVYGATNNPSRRVAVVAGVQAGSVYDANANLGSIKLIPGLFDRIAIIATAPYVYSNLAKGTVYTTETLLDALYDGLPLYASKIRQHESYCLKAGKEAMVYEFNRHTSDYGGNELDIMGKLQYDPGPFNGKTRTLRGLYTEMTKIGKQEASGGMYWFSGVDRNQGFGVRFYYADPAREPELGIADGKAAMV